MNDLNIKKYEFPSIVEKKEQGVLRVFESEDVPFTIKRVFTIVNAFRGSQRGQHAHKKCNQLLCCVSGEVNLICDDGNTQIETLLTPSSEAVLVPNGIWAEQKYLKDNTVIISFCDQSYDEQDYIRDYDEYLEWKKEQK
jgi:dTDP-4-dehydrorhamnose 3,5-epimerase-like enzyme